MKLATGSSSQQLSDTETERRRRRVTRKSPRDQGYVCYLYVGRKHSGISYVFILFL